MTKNLHLEHPEDVIMTGDLSVLDWFDSLSTLSVKMDGAPAIVWGTNPENGLFFVGTKSVFNKRKVKINYTVADIKANYDEGEYKNLIKVLTHCLIYLPRTENIYQGDFIGFGGEQTYTPNTITYDFREQIFDSIIMCPHTVYTGDTIRDCVASPLTHNLESTPDTLFVQPTVDCHLRVDTTEMRELASRCIFPGSKHQNEIKVIINAFIREGKCIEEDMLTHIVGDRPLAQLMRLMYAEKMRMIESMVVYDGPTASIDGEIVAAEGFVRCNRFGNYKLVDRWKFSRANFNKPKAWTKK